MISPAEITVLWRKHASGLELLARARFPDKADDLVQEAFIRLAKQPTAPDDPLSWLLKTVRNLAIDAARSEARRKRREQLFYETQSPPMRDADAPQFSAAELNVALHRLTAEDRDIVIAHLWNSMTFRQIAKAFSMSSSTVNRRYLRALQQLKNELGTAKIEKANTIELGQRAKT
ncbi:MAG: sigma-70 family RNA polymerase sigma factor [Pirellulaceae bacterium]